MFQSWQHPKTRCNREHALFNCVFKDHFDGLQWVPLVILRWFGIEHVPKLDLEADL